MPKRRHRIDGPAVLQEVWGFASQAARDAFCARLPAGFIDRMVGLGLVEEAVAAQLAYAFAYDRGHRRIFVGNVVRTLGPEWELEAFVARMDRLTLRRKRKGES